MKQQLQIRIYPDGRIDARTQGIKGKKCTQYIPIVEQLLQARVTESSYTPEYYQSEELQVEEQKTLQIGK